MTVLYRIALFVLPSLLMCAHPNLGRAHEFWISPDQYQVPMGGTIEARLRNGENLEGVELAFFERRAARHSVTVNGQEQAIVARSGDRPAITLTDLPDGLAVIAHETTASRLTYRDWQKFVTFAEHKDFPTALDQHVSRGLSQELFRENYTRHAKALVAVGSGTGADLALGLETEFVALSNPYDDAFDQSFSVRLLYKDAPRAGAQVEIFERAHDGTVSVRFTRTDDTGTATISTQPGHEYLLDAVILRIPEYSGTDIAWETLWAAMTFAVPE